MKKNKERVVKPKEKVEDTAVKYELALMTKPISLADAYHREERERELKEE